MSTLYRHANIVTDTWDRPASLQLPHLPNTIHSSPDGSCLLLVDKDYDQLKLQVFHWSSFGSTNGIQIELPGFPTDSWVVTSFVHHTKCHLIGLDCAKQSLRSAALDITHRVTEFTFKEHSTTEDQKATNPTAHNCLVDCHADVWTRFPVIPAVSRQTMKSSRGRLTRSLTYVSPLPSDLFEQHHADLIIAFERNTRKPTENQLADVLVSGVTYRTFTKDREMAVSTLWAGEWLVDMLCLIPIHIAIARENRFIPLKDGVSSSQLERSLLGATVDQIIDRLSFGWYESIFQSYMASKVRIVGRYISNIESDCVLLACQGSIVHG